MIAEARSLLDFWFEGEPDRFRKRWFLADPAFDAALRERFRETWEAARAGAREDWAATPLGALALVLALDQLPRNLHRGFALAFATDRKARSVASAALERGFERSLGAVERLFLYLPFEHSESIADQERSVALFEAEAASPGFAGPDGPIAYARRHRDVIRRFGRFPHRNEALGRRSTPDERAWLAEHEKGF